MRECVFAIAVAAMAAAVCQAESDLVAGEVKKLAGDFRFTEGPAADKEGAVYFTDIPNNRIHIWTVDGKLTIFRENSGAANGLYFDPAGNLYVCEGGNRRVTKISLDGKVDVLADSYMGKKLNSPNDLWVDPKGGVYFTDPRYGAMDNLELDHFYVFYITPDRELVLLLDDLVKPNGVLGTADGKYLFVADPGDSKTYRYTIQDDGSLADRKLFAEQGSDGMTLDEKGNLYLTDSGLTVYDPQGKKIETIAFPERPANMTFGGADRKTLFVTARTSLYAVPMKVRGQD